MSSGFPTPHDPTAGRLCPCSNCALRRLQAWRVNHDRLGTVEMGPDGFWLLVPPEHPEVADLDDGEV